MLLPCQQVPCSQVGSVALGPAIAPKRGSPHLSPGHPAFQGKIEEKIIFRPLSQHLAPLKRTRREREQEREVVVMGEVIQIRRGSKDRVSAAGSEGKEKAGKIIIRMCLKNSPRNRKDVTEQTAFPGRTRCSIQFKAVILRDQGSGPPLPQRPSSGIASPWRYRWYPFSGTSKRSKSCLQRKSDLSSRFPICLDVKCLPIWHPTHKATNQPQPSQNGDL